MTGYHCFECTVPIPAGTWQDWGCVGVQAEPFPRPYHYKDWLGNDWRVRCPGCVARLDEEAENERLQERAEEAEIERVWVRFRDEMAALRTCVTETYGRLVAVQELYALLEEYRRGLQR